MPADRVYKCRVRPCQNVKGASNHWFVASIDKDNRLIFEKFDRMERFAQAAARHGAQEICSEKCCSVHLSRWMHGQIDASNAPECGSPAAWTATTLTAWVSCVYKSNSYPARGDMYGRLLAIADKSPARIISFRDQGSERQIWCFNQEAFPRIDAAVCAHVKFSIQQRHDYAVVLDVIEVLDANSLRVKRETP